MKFEPIGVKIIRAYWCDETCCKRVFRKRERPVPQAGILFPSSGKTLSRKWDDAAEQEMVFYTNWINNSMIDINSCSMPVSLFILIRDAIYPNS